MHDTRPRYTCGGCTNTWTGLAQCHCAADCHQTFGSITGFDRHRSNGQCRPPEDVGLAIGARGVWAEPFSWQRAETDEPIKHLLAAFRNGSERGITRHTPHRPTTTTTSSIYTDPTSSRTIYTPDKPIPRDELLHWLQHGHIDTDGPEQCRGS